MDKHKIFAKARINKKWKYISFDCVGLSVKDEPGMKEFQGLIDGAKQVVKAFLGKAYQVVETQGL